MAEPTAEPEPDPPETNSAGAFLPSTFPCADNPLDPASYLQQAAAELRDRRLNSLLSDVFELPSMLDDSDPDIRSSERHDSNSVKPSYQKLTILVLCVH